ncbi:MAG: DUF1080 domain-containing protein [Puia sp.]|nr:DUF1080 domain-containing protein [Puia sp.]
MNRKQLFLALPLFLSALIQGKTLRAQEELPLTDLSFFQNPSDSWQTAGDVRADLDNKDQFFVSGGKGILVNQVSSTHHGADLFTKNSYGDLDLELDYMMAKGANSGIYLQGRYEVQLLDSWGRVHPTASDNGAIYERWDDSRPDGQKGYDGHAPRQNASRAPGVWQHLKICFQAPRFDAAGNKIASARILSVELNGVTIQENLELPGPTRGSVDNQETASGPLRIQGDHGSVAFRNIVLTSYDKHVPTLAGLQYSFFGGKYGPHTDLTKLKPLAEGKAALIGVAIPGLPKNEFALCFKASLHIEQAGTYLFNLNSNAGNSLLLLNGKSFIKPDSTLGAIYLPAGEQSLELRYFKTEGYGKPALGLGIQGPGFRETALGDPTSAPVDGHDDPILINADQVTVMRSFIDLKGTIVTHAVSVGSPDKVNYTYDLDHGMLVQLWRGDFLDATPMWHDRGNGQSIPRGAIQRLGKPAPAIESLATAQSSWTADTTGSAYRPKGYALDKSGNPVFRYLIYGSAVEDKITVSEEGHGIRREITVKDPVPGTYIRLAEGSSIEELSNGYYLVDDKSYYLKWEGTGATDSDKSTKPFIRDSNGRKELIVPVSAKSVYTILF